MLHSGRPSLNQSVFASRARSATVSRGSNTSAALLSRGWRQSRSSTFWLVGMDLAKIVCQVHAVDVRGNVQLLLCGHGEVGLHPLRSRPALRNSLQARIEAHAFGTVHAVISEQRITPTAKAVEGHWHGD